MSNATAWKMLVKAGKAAVASHDDSQWVLGDLACEVETNHGDKKLQTFADEIGVEYKTLLRYRDVCRAWPESARQRAISFEVHKALCPEDAQHLLVEGMTLAQARTARQELEGQECPTPIKKTTPVDTKENSSTAADKTPKLKVPKKDEEIIEDADWSAIPDGEGLSPRNEVDIGETIADAAQSLDGAVRYAAELLRIEGDGFVLAMEAYWGEQPTNELIRSCGNFAVNLARVRDEVHPKAKEVAA